MQAHIKRSVLCAEQTCIRWFKGRTGLILKLVSSSDRGKRLIHPWTKGPYQRGSCRANATLGTCGGEPLISSLPSSKRDLVLKYLDSVLEFNQHTNLTAVRDRVEAVQKHINDSLSLLPPIDVVAAGVSDQDLKILDVGSGAGFPGVIIAIARPQWQVTVLDSLKKRCDFVKATLQDLAIDNVDVLWGRAEAAGQNPEHREKYHIAVARAVAEMRVLSEYCLPFVQVGGALVAAKGPFPQQEVEDAQQAISLLGGELVSIDAVQSYSDGESMPRTAVTVRKVSRTPPAYSRREGRPLKRPL